MKTNEKHPPILTSKTEKVFIELPNYTFNHSTLTSNMPKSSFLGRKELINWLKSLIIHTSSKTGVYLVTGNRGVGKSSLIDKVIDDTSFKKGTFSDFVKYMSTILFFVVILQYCSYRFEDIETHKCPIIIFLSILSIFLFFMIGHVSHHRRKAILYKKRNFCRAIGRTFLAALIDTKTAPEYSMPFMKSKYFLRILFISCLIQLLYMLFSTNQSFTHIRIFVIYLSYVLMNAFWAHSDTCIMDLYKENKVPDSKPDDLYKLTNSCISIFLYLCFIIFSVSISVLIFYPDLVFDKEKHENYDIITWFYAMIKNPYFGAGSVLLLISFGTKNIIWANKTFKPGLFRLIFEKAPKFTFYYSIIHPIAYQIKRYLKNRSRIFLKINLGHNILNEKDILRLITRMISTEHRDFCKSLKHTLIWKLISLLTILLFTNIFYELIYIKDLRPLLIEKTYLYDNNSQSYITDLEKSSNGYKVKRNDDFVENYIFNQTINAPIIQIDKVINKIWYYICVIPEYLWIGKESAFSKKRHTPINYAFLLIFLCVYLACDLLLKSKYIMTHRKIRWQLKNLNDAITYNIEKGNSYNSTVEKSGFFNFKFGTANSIKKYRIIADEREIEKELQDILNNLQHIPIIMHKPEFILVFDELDKVGPGERSKDPETTYKTKEAFFSINATRERQAIILRLLSNLKYFLTTANAKFIFIAGREMYDMYLADISDRNNFIGSIFNDVIFVPSFLSDHSGDNYSDMTSLVESYVCRRLIPDRYLVTSYNLENYKRYLDDMIFSQAKGEYEKEANMKKQKIIAFLQQFIIYLAHTSKGAPKKITQIFESFIETHEKRALTNRFCVKLYKNTQFFLSFNYYDQYVIGMTAYLVSPIIYRFSDSNIREHSDKLLISSLHFVDFLLKFHSHNFSWKNLDISPEMIEINRAPELKSIANDLLNYMKQIHIDKSALGLYEYRFENLISQEFSFITKMHEGFSALFNFSLDESLALKQYYKVLLNEAQNKYKSGDNKFVNSISSLQIVLGDLHFYDDELEEAGGYYKDGVQMLRNRSKNEEMNLEQLYLLIRNMLKLGYIYEKRKQYDFAYLTYSNLCNHLIETRNQPLSPIFEQASKQSLESQTFEGLKLLYLPLLTKFQILEKSHLGGITKNHITQLEKEFKCLKDDFTLSEVNILTADFYARVGDVLYYKNPDFNNKENKDKTHKIKISCEACKFYKLALTSLLLDRGTIQNNTNIFDLLNKGIMELKNSPNAKFCNLIARIFSDLGNIFFTCNNAYYKTQPKNNHICEFAIVIKDFGKTEENTGRSLVINELFWKNWKEFINPDFTSFDMSLINELNKVELVLLMYSLSIKFYKTANYHKRAAYQITKILNVFKHCLNERLIPSETIKDQDIDILTKNALRSIYLAYDNVNILEINKRKKVFFALSDKSDSKIPLQNILVDSEIGRIRILAKELKLKLDHTPQKLNVYYSMYITSPYAINYSISARIYRLRLKSILNWRAYEIMKSESLEHIFNNYYEDFHNLGCPFAQQMAELLKKYKKDDNNKIIDSQQEINAIKESINDACPEENKKKLNAMLQILKCRLFKTEKNIYIELMSILSYGDFWKNNKETSSETSKIFKDFFTQSDSSENMNLLLFEKIVADSIFCLNEIVRLCKTAGVSYLFNHSFIGSMYYKMANWTILYESYKTMQRQFKTNKNSVDKLSKAFEIFEEKEIKKIISTSKEDSKNSRIDGYLRKFLGNEWEEQLSGYYNNHQALSHYYKSIETHKGGLAYTNLIDNMYYLKGDFNDRINHFNIAVERFIINSGKVNKIINTLENRYKDSTLHHIDNFFEHT
jgi:hypothetical protein